MKYQWIAFQTLLRKEISRIIRIWTQTLLPPLVTQSLYFIIFGKFIGSQVGAINGVTYMSFIVPGLVMMAVINSAYGNVVSSFFGAKFQRSIEEMLVSPMQEWVIVGGYATAGIIRGIVVGALVFLVSCFFTHPTIHQFGIVMLFMILTSAVFSLAALINGIFARNFDEVAIFQNFVLVPLIYLGGVFYSISRLPVFWQNLSKLNPILYMIDGFRYGFFGFSDVSVPFSAGLLIVLTLVLWQINIVLLKKGIGIKS
ncbi:MAG: ABC transporter permease [Candidatus Omnitrophica bacterium]|nr:ABC transporter permease [Candidatus Omnitrophota bacterium]MBF0489711.1 ABC transporter permease [Candidatus Omnitrophota bacterium]